MDINQITKSVIGAAIEVHRTLGPGLLESVYEECLCHEFSLRNINFERQVLVPVHYEDIKLNCGYRIDILVEDEVVIEVKSIDKIHPIHEAQLLSYLKSGGWHIGLLLNFNVLILKQGIRRIVNNLPESKQLNRTFSNTV